MSIIMFIILGGIVGWIAARLMGREEGVFGSIIIGIVGSFIGSFVARLINSGSSSYLALNWSGLIWSLIGAVILVAIMNAFSGRRHHHPVN
jgi:uncharacterized membrane protein YeaQ/YmgE (transglycosylase-associated protein family)